jgi:uncharacterized protein
LMRLVVFYPKSVIAATLLLTAAAIAVVATRGMGFDGGPETLARKDEEFRFFEQTRASFGDDRIIIVALTTTDVFTEEFFTKLDRLTSRLRRIEGVTEALSLTNIKTIRRRENEINIGPLLPPCFSPACDFAGNLRKVKQEVTGDPLYVKHYVSEDGKTAGITVFVDHLDEAATRNVAKEVERVARSEAGPDEILLAGVPIMDLRAIETMIRDIVVISPVAALLCFLVFLFAFRSLWGAILAVAALTVGIIWTAGCMSLFGRPITFTTLLLPTVLMAVGGSFIFHALNQYRISISQLAAQADARQHRTAWLGGLNFIAPALIVSGTCTMAGFGALAVSPIPTVRDMGVFEALGVLFMLVLTLGFLPAVLTFLPPRLSRAAADQKDYAPWLNGLLREVTALVLFRGRRALVTCVVLTAIVAAGVYRLRMNTDYLSIFPRGSETAWAAEKLHERLAGAASIQIVVSGQPGAATQPDFLRSLTSLEKFALGQPGVDAAISVADIVERFRETLVPGNPDLYTKMIFDEYLSQDDFIFRLVTRDYSRAAVVLRTNLFGSNELKALTDKIQEWSRVNLPTGTTAQATGTFVLLNDASDDVARSQVSSLAIALVSIYVMMVVLFRSFRLGLVALIPNLLPVLAYFGFLGWSGITLDITSSLVATAALGLAVDNAVHMIRRYRQSIDERGGKSAEDEGWAMWLTMLRTGKPIVLANAMLIAAFLLFMLSSFTPVRVGGLLWAITILACLVADLVMLPVLMKARPFARAALRDSSKNGTEHDAQQYSDLQEAAK